MVYLAASLLLIANMIAWVSTFVTLPGNWFVLLFAVLYAYFLPANYDPRLSWTIVVVIAVLAILGELIEFVAGAAGAAKHGGSRWGMLFSLVGAFVGSIFGAIMLSVIPILGTMAGALLGGALGAFGGAWLGEHLTDKTDQERWEIGKGAFVGRILGTVGKLAIGALMVALVTIDSFFDLSARPKPVDSAGMATPHIEMISRALPDIQ
ncbi:DUF456 family protein [bacterium]|nr:DUF456 family protein [bacterium]